MIERYVYLPEDGAHYYEDDGTPRHTVPNLSKPGEERNTTITDARKLNLLSSVSVILRVPNKPALVQYLIRQHVESALTLPHVEGESSDDFVRRVMLDAKQHGEQAAAFGTRMHSYIESRLSGGHIPMPALNIGDYGIMGGVDEWLDAHPIEVEFLERNLASRKLGYGGRLDCVGTVHGLEDYPNGLRCLVDWKSQEGRIVKGEPHFNHYPEAAMQGAAYDMLLGEPMLPHLVLYVDSKVPGHIEPVVYTQENAPWRWPAFVACKYLYYNIGPGQALSQEGNEDEVESV